MSSRSGVRTTDLPSIIRTRPVGLLHRDVGPGHVLLCTSAGPLSGAIDFGDLAMGDSARDFIGIFENSGLEIPTSVLERYAREGAASLLPLVRAWYVSEAMFWTMHMYEMNDRFSVPRGITEISHEIEAVPMDVSADEVIRPVLRRWQVVALLLLGACASNGGTTGAEPPPRPGARVFAISTNPRPVPPPTSSDFLAAFDLAAAAGARGGFLSYTWSSLEADAGKLDVRRVRDDIAFAHSRGMRILLGIQVINTTAKETPADLRSVAFDDARMRARFHALIDSIASAFPSVAYISIGNEVGAYLSLTGGWDAYRAFYAEAVGYVHAKAPSVLVGVTNEYLRAAGPDRAQAAALIAASDIAVFTFYPLGSNFHVTGPSATRSAFPDMLALANGKPVIVQELGYPSASLLGSSEQQQADFFTDATAQWASQRSEQMPFLNVFLLHDFTQAQCDAFGAYYALPNSAEFKAFLCSLGLRGVDGTPKAAWAALQAAARKAGLP